MTFTDDYRDEQDVLSSGAGETPTSQCKSEVSPTWRGELLWDVQGVMIHSGLQSLVRALRTRLHFNWVLKMIRILTGRGRWTALRS